MPTKVKLPPSRSKNGQPAAKAEEPVKKKIIKVVPLRIETIQLHLIGDTPLIVHEFSAKERERMLAAQTGEASGGKEKKNPLEQFRLSLYTLPDGYGFPTRGFKACAVKAANDVELVKTEMKRAIRVCGPSGNDMDVDSLVKIEAPPLDKNRYTKWDKTHEVELKAEHSVGISMREDIVRLANGSADIRFRGCFPLWRCKLTVKFNACVVTADQLVALYNAAGFGVGIGEWRPGAPKNESGQFGCFHVATDEDRAKFCLVG